MEHFKTMEDLREYIKNLGKFYARPSISGDHPTLYLDHSQGQMIHGIREKDYIFSPCKKWVIPHNQMGLSFSAHWQHLKDRFKMKSRHAEGKPVNVYWVLEAADIPDGLKFVQDKREQQHYLLTVTEKMTVYQLARKLSWVADRMTKISDARKAL
jgi:hypothetical protein